MSSPFKTVRILGIDFYNDHFERVIQEVHQEGGLFLAPSGPGLSDLGQNAHYDRALREADVNLIDSGYLALLWKQRTGQQLERHSGLKFIKALIEDATFQNSSSQLWIMPTPVQTAATIEFLQHKGFALCGEHFYQAPFYTQSPVTDAALLEKIRADRPDYVILAIAGGKQEVLGHWLRTQLDYKPAIICIGAAIAFLSGQQANIPPWADRIYIGWLLRILTNPKTFLPRYWKARKLKHILHTYGPNAPAQS